MKVYFLLPQCCQILDYKFKMGGLIDTILMCVKIDDDPISSLDFSFSWGRSLNNNRKAIKEIHVNPSNMAVFQC